jgi:DNA-binding response OmpR family regulator
VTKKILLADDNKDFSQALALALEAEGYAVETAANGREAIALQRRAPADILITDLVMPESDGMELINLVRAEFPQTKLVVLSGAEKLDTPRYLTAAQLLGAHATFRKPFEVEELLRTLKALA